MRAGARVVSSARRGALERQSRSRRSRVRHPGRCRCSATPPQPPEPLRLRDTALAAAWCAVAGSLAAAPISSLAPLASSTLPAALSTSWELDQDTLALTLAVFGAVAARSQLSARVPLALACLVARVGAHVHPSATCTPTPLTCGAGYFDAAMLSDVAATTVAAGAALATALGCLQALSARESV